MSDSFGFIELVLSNVVSAKSNPGLAPIGADKSSNVPICESVKPSAVAGTVIFSSLLYPVPAALIVIFQAAPHNSGKSLNSCLKVVHFVASSAGISSDTCESDHESCDQRVFLMSS